MSIIDIKQKDGKDVIELTSDGGAATIFDSGDLVKDFQNAIDSIKSEFIVYTAELDHFVMFGKEYYWQADHKGRDILKRR